MAQTGSALGSGPRGRGFKSPYSDHFKNILVFQSAFLGDLILTSPLIKSIAKTFPKASISLVVRKGLEQVYEDFPYVSHIITLDKNIIRFHRFLRSQNFDIAISPHRSHRTSIILFLSGIKRRIGFENAGFSFLYTDSIPYVKAHEVERNLKLLSPFKNAVLDRNLELPLSNEKFNSTLRKFRLENYICLSPGSMWETKRWPARYYAEVADELSRNFNVVLIGSKSDIPTCNAVESIAKSRMINTCGRTSIKDLFAVVKGSRLLISNDSAPVHVASAFNVPTVAIFGPTVPDFGFYPYRNGIVAQLEGLDCRPCSIHGGRNCPKGNFKCMLDLKPSYVLGLSRKMLR